MILSVPKHRLSVIFKRTARAGLTSPATAAKKSPEQIDDNKGRRQRRFFLILDSETVPVEAPRLETLLFHFLICVATV